MKTKQSNDKQNTIDTAQERERVHRGQEKQQQAKITLTQREREGGRGEREETKR